MLLKRNRVTKCCYLINLITFDGQGDQENLQISIDFSSKRYTGSICKNAIHFISHHGNTNQSHNKVLLYHCDSYNPKRAVITRVPEEVEKLEPLCAASGNVISGAVTMEAQQVPPKS